MNYGLTWEKKPRHNKRLISYKTSGYTRIWLAVDRNRSSVVDFEVGYGSQKTALNLFERVIGTDQTKICNKVHNICTDDNPTYQSIMRYYTPEFGTKHHITKKETCLVEAKNSSLRDNLARLNRRTNSTSATMKLFTA